MPIPIGWYCCCLIVCPVRLCETVGWEGAAQVLDWSRLDCQSSQRPSAERPPGNRLHRVHGPRHLAPRSLQRRTEPGASVTPQHSHRWGGLLHLTETGSLCSTCSVVFFFSLYISFSSYFLYSYWIVLCAFHCFYLKVASLLSFTPIKDFICWCAKT